MKGALILSTTFAERFINILEKNSVRHAFGIPGGPWLPYMELMASSNIRFHLVVHEAAGATMADVCARLTGVPALCHGTFGPGATNLSTGVCCAYLDRTPLIACTSVMGDSMKNRITQMNIDHDALFRPITKSTVRLTPENIAPRMQEEIERSLAEVPGPVHFGLPSDCTNKEVGPSEKADLHRRLNTSDQATMISGRPAHPIENPNRRAEEALMLPPLDQALQKGIADRIRKSKKPIIAAGLTAVRSGLADTIGKIAAKHRIPVFLTPMAKGLIPSEHPWYGGVLFHALSHCVAELYEQADLVLAVGYDPVEFNLEEWIGRLPLIDINTVPLDIDEEYRAKNPVFEAVCDVRSGAQYFLNMDPVATAWELEEVRKKREEVKDQLRPEGRSFDIRSVLHHLRSTLPPDGIMTCDVGAHTHVIGQMWDVDRPGLQIMTNGGSSMGFGIPAAVGAALCMPKKKVMCVTGDGGFLMMAGEIATARKAGLNIVFVVLSDNKLALMDVKKRWKNFDRTDIDLYSGPLIGEQTFLGVPVFTVSRESELREALEGCFQHEGPIVIEARIDPEPYHSLISGRYTAG